MAPFDEALDPATPGGSDPVSSGDDMIRQFKRAMIERFESIIEDIDVEPWVLKRSAVVSSGAIHNPAGAAGIILNVPIIGQIETFTTRPAVGSGVVQSLPAAELSATHGTVHVEADRYLSIYVVPQLPAGAIITNVRLLGVRSAADTLLTFRVFRNEAGVITTSTATIASAGTVSHWTDAGGVLMDVPVNGFIDIKIEVGGSPAAGSGMSAEALLLEITYNMPP